MVAVPTPVVMVTAPPAPAPSPAVSDIAPPTAMPQWSCQPSASWRHQCPVCHRRHADCPHYRQSSQCDLCLVPWSFPRPQSDSLRRQSHDIAAVAARGGASGECATSPVAPAVAESPVASSMLPLFPAVHTTSTGLSVHGATVAIMSCSQSRQCRVTNLLVAVPTPCDGHGASQCSALACSQ